MTSTEPPIDALPSSPRAYITHSVAETEAVAVELARTLTGGMCIALDGELGAGKTQFVRGLVRGLGGDGRAVSSPTFVLLNIYGQPSPADVSDAPQPRQRLIVFHLDAYRLGGSDDLESIGFSELLDEGGVVVVEWALRVPALLPPRRVSVTLTHEGNHTRRITISRNAET